jgi:4,5-dihydroxyphthalate decarboxylase
LHPSEMFFRQLKYAEFDVSEMSNSSLTIATSQGLTGWVGIPVFTSRQFFHTNVLIRTDRGIEKPADLAGKSFGVPEFQQTAALWTRAALRSEFGVDPRTMHWHMERNPDQSHGGATGFVPPPGIDLQYIPKTKNIGQMLIDGELDAGRWIDARNLVDRSVVDPRTSPKVRYLFDPPAAEAKRYYAKTNIYPINHCLVVRRSIAEKYPWVMLNLYSMFLEAKARNAEALDETLAPYLESGLLDRKAATTIHTDVMPYGIKANRYVLETITQAVVYDGLAKRRVGLEELFAPSTMDL